MEYDANLNNYDNATFYDYDANGNLLELKRYVDIDNVEELMDHFQYIYNDPINNMNNNRLSGIIEQAGVTKFGELHPDISNTITGSNYEYDAIGQLVKDIDENIDLIKWTVTNKVDEILFSDGKIIKFAYDAMGNRIAKHTIENGIRTSTYYSLDAQGHTMAVYKYGEQEDLKIEERMIYGSSRLGMEQLGTNMSFISLNSYSSVDFSTFNPSNDLTGLCSEAGVLSVINEHLANQFELYDYELNDFNNDGAIDLKVNNTIQGQGNDFTANFSAQVMINTTPGESYDVYFDIDMNAYVCSFAVYECQGSNVNLQVNFTEEGSYMMSFVASSSLSRLKWFTLSNKDGEEFEASDITISSFRVEGKGDVYGVNPSVEPVYDPYIVTSILGDKRYELTNHLGNVLAIVTDQKLPEANQNNGVEFFDANVIMYSDYYPFGMQMPGRHGSDNSEGEYRYGFQGQEVDGEIKGEGNSVNYKYRMHDPRVGRFFAVDPITSKYPYNSPYAFSENRVMDAIELEGREAIGPNSIHTVGYLMLLPNHTLIVYQRDENGSVAMTEGDVKILESYGYVIDKSPYRYSSTQFDTDASKLKRVFVDGTTITSPDDPFDMVAITPPANAKIIVGYTSPTISTLENQTYPVLSPSIVPGGPSTVVPADVVADIYISEIQIEIDALKSRENSNTTIDILSVTVSINTSYYTDEQINTIIDRISKACSLPVVNNTDVFRDPANTNNSTEGGTLNYNQNTVEDSGGEPIYGPIEDNVIIIKI